MVLPAVSPHSARHGQACFCSDLSREAPGQGRRQRGTEAPEAPGGGHRRRGASRSQPLIKTHWPWERPAPRRRRPGRCGCSEPRLQPVHSPGRRLGSLLSPWRALAGMGSLCSCVSVGKVASPARGVSRRGRGSASRLSALKVNDSKAFGNGKTQRFSVLT